MIIKIVKSQDNSLHTAKCCEKTKTIVVEDLVENAYKL